MGIRPDDEPCERPRSVQYGEYCYTCGRAGYRKLCAAKQSNGDDCIYKVKEGDYCGRHKNYGVKITMDIEKVEIFVTQIILMDVEVVDIVTYTKEEYQEMLEIEQLRNDIFQYREHLLSLELDEKGVQKRDNLIIIRHPHLIYEWDFKMNKDLDLKILTCGSGRYAYWKCSNINHPTYRSCISTRTTGSICKQCYHDSTRKYKKEDKIETIKKRTRKNTVEIGDATEQYIVDLLIATQQYKSVVKIGNVSGDADIQIIHHDNSENFIQVKTLIHQRSHTDRYTLKLSDKYDDNMLIAATDKERRFFVLAFAKDIPLDVAFCFQAKYTKYKNFMYYDVKIFTDKLIEFIPLSVTENTILNKQSNKEIESMKRLELFCRQNNLEFKRNSTNGNTIDGYINGYSIQTKFVTFPTKDHICFHVNSSKYAASVGKTLCRKPYEISDFDFIIIELSGTRDKNKTQYLGNFCIIPAAVLIKQKIMTSDNVEGKTNFTIFPPDYELRHWSMPWWNNIDALLIPKNI